MEETQKRQIAYIASIEELKKGEYVKKEGWSPSFVKIGEKEVSRVNVIGVIVSKNEEPNFSNASFDDSTGIIDLVFFDDRFKNLQIGIPVMVVGRIREYGGKKSIVPEIIKEIKKPRWLHLRKLQLEKAGVICTEVQKAKKEEPSAEQLIGGEVVGEASAAVESKNKYDQICQIIKNLDNGAGADHQLVVEEANMEDTERILSYLLAEGEIFEIGSGKLKVLE